MSSEQHSSQEKRGDQPVNDAERAARPSTSTAAIGDDSATRQDAPLKGEGEVQYIKRTRVRHECAECGEPADFRHSYLRENARRNPASSGYGGDDITWCSDAESFVCEAHKDKRQTPDGHNWGGTFTLARYPHMGLYWREEKIAPAALDEWFKAITGGAA